MGIRGKIVGRLPDFAFNIVNYRKYHQQFPNIFNPKTLNEKILYRMIFDRRPILTQFADKYGVRQYVESRIGSEILSELYYVTQEPETIPFHTLPDRFVIKPTHGSGWIRIVTDKSTINRQEIISECRAWLAQSYYKIGRERVYKNVQPKIIVEEFIDDGNGSTPRDYKFYTYNGVPAFIHVDMDRFKKHKRDIYNTEWEKLPILLAHDNFDTPVPRPKHFEEMLKAAQLLGKGIDFVRIDFYDTDKKVYFGEITTTPGRAEECFSPPKYDSIFGERWKIR